MKGEVRMERKNELLQVQEITLIDGQSSHLRYFPV